MPSRRAAADMLPSLSTIICWICSHSSRLIGVMVASIAAGSSTGSSPRTQNRLNRGRLDQIVIRSPLDHFNRGGDAGIAGHEHDAHERLRRAQRRNQIKTISSLRSTLATPAASPASAPLFSSVCKRWPTAAARHHTNSSPLRGQGSSIFAFEFQWPRSTINLLGKRVETSLEDKRRWIPACAGTTSGGVVRNRNCHNCSNDRCCDGFQEFAIFSGCHR